ncbi:MAG: hypothetical protein GX927_07825, partial [Lentisphaerae bacterium]|nr:hypothetical protein [Lentisphaerota bacterium]
MTKIERKKLIISLLSLLLIILTSQPLRSENLLHNADFSTTDMDSVPAGWSGKGVRAADGAVLLRSESDSAAFLAQRISGLQTGVHYQLKYELRSLQSSNARIRIEGSMLTTEGKRQPLCSDNWQWQTVKPEWVRKQQIFWMPEEASDTLTFAINLQNKKTGAEIEIKHPVLQVVIPENLPDGLGGVWRLFGGSYPLNDGKEGVLAITAFARHAPGAVLAKIPIDKGELIKLSYSVQGLGESGLLTGFHNYRIELHFSSGEIVRMPWEDVWNSTPQKRTLKIDNRMRKASSIDLHFYVNSEGAVKFKDLALEKYQVTPNEKNKIILTSPAYRQSIYSSFPCEFLAGKFETAANVTDIELHFETSTGQRLAHLLTSEMHFRIPATDLPEGVYLLKATFLDKDQRVVSQQQLEISKLPPAKNEVIIGPERNFYINGKPFLPVVFWAVGGNDDCLEYAATNGMNVYVGRPGREAFALPLLEQALSLGIKVVFGIRHCEDGDLEGWKKRTKELLTAKVLEHPALFAFFLADEPLWTGANLKDLQASYEILRRHDPYHPVWINSAPLSRIEDARPYCLAADINGVDIYPIPYPSPHSSIEDKYPTAVGKYTRNIMSATDGTRAVIMVLQG